MGQKPIGFYCFFNGFWGSVYGFFNGFMVSSGFGLMIF